MSCPQLRQYLSYCVPLEMKKHLIISDNLNYLFQAIESNTQVKLIDGEIRKIFSDAENDQVSRKEYSIFKQDGQFLIKGIVEDYEPETIILDLSEPDPKTKQVLIDIVDIYNFSFGSGASFRTKQECIAIFNKGIKRIPGKHYC